MTKSIYDIRKLLEDRDSVTFTAEESSAIKQSIQGLVNPALSVPQMNGMATVPIEYSIDFYEENGIITAKRTKV